MRKVLLISASLLFALGAGLWAATRSPSSVKAPQAVEPVSAPAEDIYAPAMPLDAALTAQGVLSVTGRAAPGASVDVLTDGVLAQTVRVGSDSVLNIEAKLPAARIRRRLVEVTFSSELSDDTRMRSEQSLIILTDPENFDQALVLASPGSATRVLQSGFGGFLRSGALTLEAADYDDAGGIIFSGAAQADARIRMQAGRTVIGETGPGAAGRWALISGAALPAGTYPIRLQSINSENRVSAQIDLLFTRLAPDTESEDESAASVEFQDSRRVLTRSLYGGGRQYTVLFSPPASQEDGAETSP